VICAFQRCFHLSGLDHGILDRSRENAIYSVNWQVPKLPAIPSSFPVPLNVRGHPPIRSSSRPRLGAGLTQNSAAAANQETSESAIGIITTQLAASTGAARISARKQMSDSRLMASGVYLTHRRQCTRHGQVKKSYWERIAGRGR
jgi:hypothetical protein